MGKWPLIQNIDFLSCRSLQVPNLECFVTRVASHPERLQYIYFNTVLLLRAVARLAPYLSEYDYCTLSGNGLTPHDHPHSPDLEDEVRTLARLDNVMTIAKRVGKFDEQVLFRGANADVCGLPPI